jgi:S-adenosylmethionine:tRNA ribosyltransferase-isomerase
VSSPEDGPPVSPEDIDYDLPEERIAQEPLPVRDSAQLLVDRGDRIEDRRVLDLPDLLSPGDLVVVNDSRVLPARIPLRRATGGAVEVLLLEEQADDRWEALVRPSARLPVGETVSAPGIYVEIGRDLGEGRRLVRLDTGDRPLLEALEDVGRPPLPPYIRTRLDDADLYQTIYAERPGSAAAPTAGLHLTHQLLDRLRNRGVAIATVELVVGLDTFRPVTVDRLEDHEIHTERYLVPDDTVAAVEAADRVVAIGTTSVRALETWALTGQQEGRSDLFIRRPFDWKVVDVLMTNFHLPRSTLLCLVDAFVGPRWRMLYEHALAEGYRFLSFGDAMLLRNLE